MASRRSQSQRVLRSSNQFFSVLCSQDTYGSHDPSISNARIAGPRVLTRFRTHCARVRRSGLAQDHDAHSTRTARLSAPTPVVLLPDALGCYIVRLRNQRPYRISTQNRMIVRASALANRFAADCPHREECSGTLAAAGCERLGFPTIPWPCMPRPTLTLRPGLSYSGKYLQVLPNRRPPSLCATSSACLQCNADTKPSTAAYPVLQHAFGSNNSHWKNPSAHRTASSGLREGRT